MSLGLKRSIRSIVMGAYGNNYTASGATLAFHALSYSPSTYEMQDVLLGTGSLTTTHTSTLYAKDHENVYRAFAANEPVYSGGRVVTNLLTYSSAPTSINGYGQSTQYDYTLANADSEIQIDFNNTGTAVALGKTSSSYVAGGTYVCTFEAKASGVIASRELFRVYDGVGFVGSTVKVLTTDWVRYSIPFTISASATSIALQFFRSTLQSGDPSVFLRKPQLEYVSGRTDTTTPSEYIVTTASPITKVFANSNGNSVSSNVVTEATGTVLTETPYLQYYPAATNGMTYSRSYDNATGWSLVAQVSMDQVGIDGAPNTAGTITDNSGAAGQQITHNSITIPSTTNPYTVKHWIKKDSDQTRFPEFTQQTIGGTSTISYTQINTATGATASRATPAVDIEVIDDGDWWVLCIEGLQGSNTSLNIAIFPAKADTLGGDNNATTGSIVIGNSEVHLNKTIAEVRGLAPIFTTTAAVSTDDTVYSFNASNVNATNAAWYCEYQPSTNQADGAAGNAPIISFDNLPYLPFDSLNGDTIRAYDGTNSATVSHSNVAFTTIQTGFVYDSVSSQMIANADGTYGTVGTFDGTMDGSELKLHVTGGGGTPIPRKYRDIRMYAITSYQEGKDKIDELMP